MTDNVAPALHCDANRHIAVEVARGNRSVAYLALENGVVLRKLDKREFDSTYRFGPPPCYRGPEPTPARWARHMLAAAHWPVDASALPVLMSLLRVPAGTADYAVLAAPATGMFYGAFSRDDALLLQQRCSGAHVVQSPKQLQEWPAAQLRALAAQVNPELTAPGNMPRRATARAVQFKLAQGVFEMATAATTTATPAPAKIAKVAKERVARADGPVAKVKAYVAANENALRSGKLTMADARAALVAQGINKSTAGVQLPKWLNEFKIDAVKGARASNGAAKAPGKVKTAKTIDGPAPGPTPGKSLAAPAAKLGKELLGAFKPAKAKPAAKKPAAKKPAAKKPAKGKGK